MNEILYLINQLLENKQDNVKQAIACLVRAQEFYNQESYPVCS